MSDPQGVSSWRDVIDDQSLGEIFMVEIKAAVSAYETASKISREVSTKRLALESMVSEFGGDVKTILSQAQKVYKTQGLFDSRGKHWQLSRHTPG